MEPFLSYAQKTTWGKGGGALCALPRQDKVKVLRWLPPVLHFPESLNFTKGFLTHHDGLVPFVARWCYNSF